MRGSCVSKRYRCDTVRIVNLDGELFEDCACRNALAVAPRGSKRSQCGAVRILNFAGEPSRCFRRSGIGAWSVLRILFGIDDPLVGFDGWQRWRVERPENSVWKRRPFRCLGRVAALVRGAS